VMDRLFIPVFNPIYHGFIRFIFLPLYSLVVMIRLRVSKLVVSARGFFFLLFTNRYVFHAVLLANSLPVILSQLQAKSATAMDIGQNSVLYALVTNDQVEIIEETIQPAPPTKNAHYLGAETIQSVPAIDYDYEETEQPYADLTIPGSVAVRPSEPGTTPSATGIALSPEELSASGKTAGERTKTESYTIKSGDSLASIARTFGVNVGTIMWANDLNVKSILQPGQILKIPSVSGVLYAVKKNDTVEKIAQRYSVDSKDIQNANRLGANELLAIGREIVIPGATPIEPPTRVAVRAEQPAPAVRPDIPLSRIKNKALDIYQEITKTPTDERAKPEDANIVAAPKTKLLWPTRLHSITQYYGWRHTGIDLDGDYTDPIYAAEDGVVEKAEWNNGGYGLMILIDHGNGLETRYGHASKLFVQAGDVVKRGQTLAMVGTTGRSTGTHLHFEVIINAKRKNPLSYIR